ncbi:hypothetical protein IOD13_01385 [Brevibacterium casei]|nr:hypothetical protein [Brevibacterium casei]
MGERDDSVLVPAGGELGEVLGPGIAGMEDEEVGEFDPRRGDRPERVPRLRVDAQPGSVDVLLGQPRRSVAPVRAADGVRRVEVDDGVVEEFGDRPRRGLRPRRVAGPDRTPRRRSSRASRR